MLLDREPLALQCALMNAQLNGLSLAPAPIGARPAAVQPAALHQLAQQLALEEAQGGSAAAAASDGRAAAAQQPGPSSGGGGGGAPGAVRAEVFDWSAPVRQQRCDVVLACDVLYESFSVEVGAGHSWVWGSCLAHGAQLRSSPSGVLGAGLGRALWL